MSANEKGKYFTSINIKKLDCLTDDEVMVDVTSFAKALKKETLKELIDEIKRIKINGRFLLNKITIDLMNGWLKVHLKLKEDVKEE